jgi:hypothetical protein
MPSYSEGRDQDDRCSKPTPGQIVCKPYLENTQDRNRLEEWLKWLTAPA